MNGLSLDSAGFALAAAAYAVHAIWFARQRVPQGGVSRAWGLYLAAAVASALWAIFGLLDLASAKLWPGLVAEQLDQFRYAAWCLALIAIGHPSSRMARGHLAIVASMTALGSGLNLWLGSAGVEPAEPSARWLAAVHLGWPILAAVLVEQVYRGETRDERWGAKPLCVAILLLSAYDIFLYSEALMFGQPDLDAKAARSLVHASAVFLLFVAGTRRAAWLQRVRLSNVAVFYTASVLLIGVYLLAVAAVGYYVRYFGGTWGGVVQLVIAFCAIATLSTLVLSGSMRARLRVFLGKHFLRYRYDYRREWLRFTAMLSTRSSPQEVGTLVIRGLADMVDSPAGSLWFRAIGDDEFVQSARWNMPANASRLDPKSAFCAFARDNEWIFDLAETDTPDGTDMPELPLWLRTYPGAWLLVPLLAGTEMLGFVILARPRAASTLNWEMRDLLKTAARQAAVFLAHMHAAEALLEARKFDAFNRMSAFVVHDLKNIMTQLSLLLKNAERHKDNPEFQQDMLLTIGSSLDKMRQMMAQLREGAKPPGVGAGVELRPLLAHLAEAARQRSRVVELEIVDPVATRGDAARLERVLGHIVQNALDATPAHGRVWVTLQQSSGRAMLVIGDTGSGMTPEFIRNHLFRPFNSTKSSGMGIGSYESFQYIRELGGSIDVQSEVDKGTRVTVLLPLFDLRTASDLRPSQAS